MIPIPFLEGFLGKKVKKSTVADVVDHLNYYVTSYLLGFFALALAGKQYFGTPIQCWAPAEFKSGWQQYAENYCFIANSYHVPFEKYHLPKHGSPERTADNYSYYRWVPLVLAIQAICFFLPNYFWSLMQRHTTLNPEGFIEEAEKISKLFGNKKWEEMNILARRILETLDEMRSFFGGRQAALLYLLTKILYVANIYIQYLILTSFLGQDYSTWGYNMVFKIWHGVQDEDSVLFPRVTMCDFKIRTIANPHAYTIQCVLMMNYINEKLYLFLYFWFIFLAIVNSLSCLHQLFLVVVPWFQSRNVRNSLAKKETTKAGKKSAAKFVSNMLRPDGVLLLRFISRDVGSVFSSQLAEELYGTYAQVRQSNLPSLVREPSNNSMKTCVTHVDMEDGDIEDGENGHVEAIGQEVVEVVAEIHEEMPIV